MKNCPSLSGEKKFVTKNGAALIKNQFISNKGAKITMNEKKWKKIK